MLVRPSSTLHQPSCRSDALQLHRQLHDLPGADAIVCQLPDFVGRDHHQVSARDAITGIAAFAAADGL